MGFFDSAIFDHYRFLVVDRTSPSLKEGPDLALSIVGKGEPLLEQFLLVFVAILISIYGTNLILLDLLSSIHSKVCTVKNGILWGVNLNLNHCPIGKFLDQI